MMDNAKKYQIWFFAGGDHGKGSPNLFTRSFIRLMDDRYGPNFRVVEGIYNRYPFLNVFWALGHAQRQEPRPDKIRLLKEPYQQIVSVMERQDTGLFLISSSYGSVVAAQTACYLAREIKSGKLISLPFHVALGASMISKKSELYKQLMQYQADGIIAKIVFDELQDEGDNSIGLGGTSRIKAYLHALGICFPFLTWKYSGPSFLNTNPETGHLHRRRAQTLEKAEDFMRIMEKMVAN
ncbi:MAG TPA: hypothetical protein DC042_14655 [Bacteroidales bacterium]|nr:hypothetical protein [Bacteroidales bacterium]